MNPEAPLVAAAIPAPMGTPTAIHLIPPVIAPPVRPTATTIMAIFFIISTALSHVRFPNDAIIYIIIVFTRNYRWTTGSGGVARGVRAHPNRKLDRTHNTHTLQREGRRDPPIFCYYKNHQTIDQSINKYKLVVPLPLLFGYAAPSQFII